MPDPLDPDRVRELLRGRYPGEIVAVAEAVSTNDLAMAAGRAGAGDGWVVFAERQTGGRGRQGRQWFAAEGESLAFSVVVRPGLGLRDWPRLTTVAGVAVAEAVELAAPCRAEIKWPNDIQIGGKKLAGILAETHAGDPPFAVIGIGINVGQERFPPPIADIAISLRQVAGAAPDRHLVAAAVLDRFQHWRRAVVEDFASAVDEAARRSCLLGREIRLIGSGPEETGVALRLDESGCLVVRHPDGSERTIASGEVSVRR
jgi:BirA family biotin operon repressor/biotin-[acetyl-CoA-carboxylase] ligase